MILWTRDDTFGGGGGGGGGGGDGDNKTFCVTPVVNKRRLHRQSIRVALLRHNLFTMSRDHLTPLKHSAPRTNGVFYLAVRDVAEAHAVNRHGVGGAWGRRAVALHFTK